MQPCAAGGLVLRWRLLAVEDDLGRSPGGQGSFSQAADGELPLAGLGADAANHKLAALAFMVFGTEGLRR